MAASPMEQLARGLAKQTQQPTAPVTFKQNVNKVAPDPTTQSDYMPGDARGPYADSGGVDGGAAAYADAVSTDPGTTRLTSKIVPYVPLPGEFNPNATKPRSR